jgi:TonB family protein
MIAPEFYWLQFMKRKLVLLIGVNLMCLLVVYGQQAVSTTRKTTAVPTATTKPAPKPTPSPLKRTATSTQTVSQEIKPEQNVAELITQGKSLYRLARFKQALAKFEAALKQKPENDEALGLAAVTAFRLDNQVQSRDYFLRRIELPDQKDSVKAYCYYRVALTYWRDAHDIIARYGDIQNGKPVYHLAERDVSDAKFAITNGLENVDRALAITRNIAEAYNVKNLLHAEAALMASDAKGAKENLELSVKALRRAIELTELSAIGKRGEAADFSQPTVRIAEYARNRDDEEGIDDPMMKIIVGGRPIRRVQAIFPTIRQPRPATDTNDPSAKSVTSASVSGRVIVEVLVSMSGEVVFARVVDGPPELNGAAIVAARSWKFAPAKFEGKPVQVSGVITFPMRIGQR